MLLEQLSGPVGVTGLPGVLGQVHVGRVQGALKLLLFGSELIIECLDLIPLTLRDTIALRAGLLGLLFGLLRAGLGLSGIGVGLGFGCRRSDGLPGADHRAEDQARGDHDRRHQRRLVLAGELAEPVQHRRRARLDRLVVR